MTKVTACKCGHMTVSHNWSSGEKVLCFSHVKATSVITDLVGERMCWSLQLAMEKPGTVFVRLKMLQRVLHLMCGSIRK